MLIFITSNTTEIFGNWPPSKASKTMHIIWNQAKVIENFDKLCFTKKHNNKVLAEKAFGGLVFCSIDNNVHIPVLSYHT